MSETRSILDSIFLRFVNIPMNITKWMGPNSKQSSTLLSIDLEHYLSKHVFWLAYHWEQVWNILSVASSIRIWRVSDWDVRPRPRICTNFVYKNAMVSSWKQKGPYLIQCWNNPLAICKVNWAISLVALDTSINQWVSNIWSVWRCKHESTEYVGDCIL